MRRNLLVCLLLAAAVVAVYWPVTRYPFVNLDDYRYVYDNPWVSRGLTAEGIRHAFADTTTGNWHPVTMLSHMLDCQLFGVEEGAGRHHTVNLSLHVANTLLLFLALRGMTGAVWRSAVVAGLFGLHPLHVESVAWVAERKDVLSTLFFMLTLLAYHAYARRPGVVRYLLVALAMALGLMSKPMLVTLPLVLLLLDYWPLGRVAWRKDGGEEMRAEGGEIEEDGEASVEDEPANVATGDNEAKPPPPESLPTFSPAWLFVEKIPLLALAVASSVVTYIVQQRGGAMGMLGPSLSVWMRLANAVASYGRYLERAFYPADLAVFYPYAPTKAVDLVILAAALAAISLAAYRLLRARPYVAVGWCWYLGTLVPVIGLVQVGAQATADRYTYIPLIGIFVVAAWAAAEFTENWPAPNRAALAVGVLAACGLLARHQVGFWADSKSLYQRAVAADAEDRNYWAHHNLGLLAWQGGHLDDAREEFEAALKIVDGLEPTHRALGALYGVTGPTRRAIEELSKAVQLQPMQPEPYRHLAWLLATCPDDNFRDGKTAVQMAEKACSLARQPLPEYFDTLAAAYAENGRFNDAVKAAREAAELARRAGDDDLVPGIEYRAALYAHGKPYHAPLERPKRL